MNAINRIVDSGVRGVRRLGERLRCRRGYTVVEVMNAMTIFAIGAAGVISMQKVTIQGGADARSFDTATAIAREWQARLNRDTYRWTEPNSAVTTSNNDNTLWLKNNVIDDTWRVPAAQSIIPGNSAAFDILGRDVSPSDAERMFCVQYRLKWIAPQTGLNGTNPTAILRAEIRVVWPRLENEPPKCNNDTGSEISASDRNKYHFVHVTTALRGNPTL